MNIDSKPIALTVVTVQLDSKKITNTVLDQIPRLDICTLFVDKDGNYSPCEEIIPVCRFSLQHFVNSQTRNYKTMRYNADHIERLIDLRSSHDEAFLFTYEGTLYCDTFSQTTGTIEYGNRHRKLKKWVSEIDSDIQQSRKIIDLHTQGVDPITIIQKSCNHFNPLPIIRRRNTKPNILDDWDELPESGATPEEEAAHELKLIAKKHGSWIQYVENLKISEADDKKLKKQYETELQAYENNVANLIKQIMSSPFAVFGL